MYTFILIMLFFIHVVIRIEKCRLMPVMIVSWALYAVLVILITLLSQQGVLEKINEVFLSTYSSDSFRYGHEASLMKENPWSVDELKGEVGAYKVTPKMGLPSLLASVGFFWGDLDIDENYILANAILVIFSFFVIFVFFKLLSELKIGNTASFLMFVFVFFLPGDLYWAVRFLRESIANILLVGLILSILGSVYFGRVYLVFLVIFGLFLVLFRAQLVLLGFCASFFIIWATSNIVGLLNVIRNRAFWVFILLIMLSGAQTIGAAGISIFSKVTSTLGLSFINPIFSVFEPGLAPYLFYAIVLTSFLPHKGSGIPDIRRSSSIRFLIIVVMFFLFSVLMDVQIRFIYPVLISIKMQILFWFITRNGMAFFSPTRHLHANNERLVNDLKSEVKLK